MKTLEITGKVSSFGGPEDMGMSDTEGLAFWYSYEEFPDIFLPHPPIDPVSGKVCTGLGRRLNDRERYFAVRWDYDDFPKEFLRKKEMALISSPKTGRVTKAYPVDWGPHPETTDKDVDVSPAVLEDLGIQSGDTVHLTFPFTQRSKTVPFELIVISSGHGLYVRGASCMPDGLDEVDEARRVVEEVAELLRERGVEVVTYHDDVSKTQNENLHRIVDFHNDQNRTLDVSVHFNAFEYTSGGRGTECWWITQKTLADQVSAAIATCGFTDRNAVSGGDSKKSTSLYFLNQTMMPSILIEVTFVDAMTDCDTYRANFDRICDAIADVLGGPDEAKLELEKLNNRGEA